LCEHLEIEEFGAYVIRRGGREETATLLKCSTCGKFLTLDSELVPEENILRKTSMTKEDMRTVTVQLNSDIYERIQKLIAEEGLGEDHSKVMNELLGLGLRNYRKILPRRGREQKK
jgi:hypothetical protein